MHHNIFSCNTTSETSLRSFSYRTNDIANWILCHNGKHRGQEGDGGLVIFRTLAMVILVYFFKVPRSVQKKNPSWWHVYGTWQNSTERKGNICFLWQISRKNADVIVIVNCIFFYIESASDINLRKYNSDVVKVSVFP